MSVQTSSDISAYADVLAEMDRLRSMITRWEALLAPNQNPALSPIQREDLVAIRISAKRLNEMVDALRPQLADSCAPSALHQIRHDLKNPLNSLIGLTYLLLRDSTGKLAPEQFMAVQSILTASRQFIEAVNLLR